MNSPPPESDSDKSSRGRKTDFASLMSPEPLVEAPLPKQKGPQATDFQSLKGTLGRPVYTPPRTPTDLLLDALTPIFIFVMVYSVIFFLLDVRYVYTEVHDQNLRAVAFFFVMGVVALNRLVARDNSDESVLYGICLGAAIGFYTITTTGAYNVGSVARNFMNDSPLLAAAFNVVLVAFVWWIVNRLTHECCVDENRTAGDIGILTGTVRRVHAFLRKGATMEVPEASKNAFLGDEYMPITVLEPIDPVEGYKPKMRTVRAPRASAADRLSQRHPGISILLFSIPVMLIFSLGLPVVRHGGASMVRAGEVYMAVYTVSALMLLMLTSLGGLRQYFRSRKIAMPGGIGWFWLGLGLFMIALVFVAASQLPKPEMPGLAHVDEHQTDFWTRGSNFRLQDVEHEPMNLVAQSVVLQRVGRGVLIVFGLFLIYGALKGFAAAAAAIAKSPRRPQVVGRFFGAVDRGLQRITRLPSLPQRKRRVRVQRGIAKSTAYDSSLGIEAYAGRSVKDHVEYAYAALCALAYDLGVPRKAAQTPYEFLAQFPPVLDALKEEAYDLTLLYVMAAYSPIEMDDQAADRLRKFWIVYNRVRNRVVR